MITKNEIADAKLSATKKDYYQIWNELLETAKKLSNRWDPTSTNESDPGIILLKVLTGIADKLNYNIDKNILEAYMPSAAQMESMRKLCDMLGYNIKYYNSAETTITMTYKNTSTNDHWAADLANVILPQFTTFSDTDDTVHYVSKKTMYLNKNIPTEIPCIEGQIVQCTSENDNIISINQLDDNNRYRLPEAQIAENGIFIYNYTTDGIMEDTPWTKVDNLNSQELGKQYFKFGYDSALGYPYIEFPQDIAQIIGNGLIIYYIRTSGINGNISAKTIATFTKPTIWSSSNYTNYNTLEVNDFYVTNANAAINGSNIETINEAYNNFKRTIGTFDTLVTCRDYMNKIYQLLDSNNNPLVSNCIVSDIRDDINRAKVLCTFNNQGICYLEESINNTTDNINKFDLMLYPFTTIKGLNTAKDYINSFMIDNSNIPDIELSLDKLKTISHQFNLGKEDELALIKVYLILNVGITTKYKVNIIEQKEIIKAVKNSLFTSFNSRQLDFGEEIATETIENVIKNADVRIQTVSMTDPRLDIKYMNCANGEYSTDNNSANNRGNSYYNKTTLKNILAGRVEMFNYDTRFSYYFDELKHPDYNSTYPNIEQIQPICAIDATNATGETPEPIKLYQNETIRFRMPNLNTILTYPAYINYYFASDNTELTINANEEYQLRNNDILYINYTTATSTDSGEKEIINIYYSAGAIIKPNFKLEANKTGGTKIIPSSTEFNSRNEKDKSTEKPNLPLPENVTTIQTLGTNEQIELRYFAETELKCAESNSTEKIFVYWTSPSLVTSLGWKNNTYTLQDGEYFYYTDINKNDMAWYGSGTEIKLNNIDSNLLVKTDDELTISPDDILKNGIAAIPWKSITLTKSIPVNSIVIKEYQYINLIAEDKLSAIIFKNEPANKTIGNHWRPVTAASYIFAGEAETNLSKFNFKDDTICWEVRAGLDINIGPDTQQQLTNRDTLKLYVSGSADPISITGFGDDTSANNPILKSNYLIQSTEDMISTVVKSYNIETETIESKNDFTLKVYKAGKFEKHKVGTDGTGSTTDKPSPINDLYHNFGEKWTRLLFTDLKDSNVNPGSYYSLALNVPVSTVSETSINYGLLMIYNTAEWTETKFTHNPYITFETIAGRSISDSLSIFNYNTESLFDGNWWKNGKVNEKRYLRPGINIIKITDSGILKIYPDNPGSDGIVGSASVIISDLDIILTTTNQNDENGINNNILKYKPIVSGISATKQLLNDIAQTFDKDYKFYYNCPIENSVALDLRNSYTMESAEILFDKNNINNKFVISEIDADSLDTNITIKRESKL